FCNWEPIPLPAQPGLIGCAALQAPSAGGISADIGDCSVLWDVLLPCHDWELHSYQGCTFGRLSSHTGLGCHGPLMSD
ncbi:hypothetical protein AB205_0184170, partial [Aquarana catesbeiana]